MAWPSTMKIVVAVAIAVLAAAHGVWSAGCSTNGGATAPQCTPVSVSGDFCSLTCECDGTGTKAPQAAMECEPGQPGASFVWYNIYAEGNVTANYNVTILTPDGPANVAGTVDSNQPATGPANIAMPQSPGKLIVDIRYPEGDATDGDGIITNTGWIPCSSEEPVVRSTSINGTKGNLTLSWSLPVPEGGPLERYAFDIWSGEDWVKVVQDLPGNTTTYTFTDLDVMCKSLAYKVQTHFVSLSGNQSEDCTDSYTPFEVTIGLPPKAPTNITINPDAFGDSRMRLKFLAPEDTGTCGSLTSFLVQVQESTSKKMVVNQEINASLAGEEITVYSSNGNFAVGSNYDVVVLAKSQAGTSVGATSSFQIEKFATGGCSTDKTTATFACNTQIFGGDCSNECSCVGDADVTNNPQMNVQCTPSGTGPSFVYYEVSSIDDQTVTYTVKVDEQVFTGTIQGVRSGPPQIDSAGTPSSVSFGMEYSPTANATAGGKLRGGWFGCKSDNPLTTSNLNIQPEGNSTFNLRWSAPVIFDSAATDRFFYTVSMKPPTDPTGDSHVVATNISGTTITQAVAVPRQCQAYEFYLKTTFINWDGTPGPDCSEPYTPLQVYVRTKASLPAKFVLDKKVELTASTVPLEWSAVEDNGGCSDVSLTINIVPSSGTQKILGTYSQQNGNSGKVAVSLTENLQPGHRYLAVLTVTTTAGDVSSSTRVDYQRKGSSSGSMGPGAVAGTVIGVLIGVVVVAGGVWYYRKHRSQYTAMY